MLINNVTLPLSSLHWGTPPSYPPWSIAAICLLNLSQIAPEAFVCLSLHMQQTWLLWRRHTVMSKRSVHQSYGALASCQLQRNKPPWTSSKVKLSIHWHLMAAAESAWKQRFMKRHKQVSEPRERNMFTQTQEHLPRPEQELTSNAWLTALVVTGSPVELESVWPMSLQSMKDTPFHWSWER